MAFNWHKFILQAFAEAPRILQTVATIHAAAPTATKLQLAQIATTAAASVGTDLDPADTETIAHAHEIAAATIDAFQAQPPAPAVVDSQPPVAVEPTSPGH